jgi:hypothetical protein
MITSESLTTSSTSHSILGEPVVLLPTTQTANPVPPDRPSQIAAYLREVPCNPWEAFQMITSESLPPQQVSDRGACLMTTSESHPQEDKSDRVVCLMTTSESHPLGENNLDHKGHQLTTAHVQPTATPTPLNFTSSPITPHYHVGDYVLRLHPSSKLGEGAPHKLGSFWQGPYRITHILQSDSMGTICTIENLVTGRLTKTHIAQLKPFKYDPTYVTPLNVAVKDTEEYVVAEILQHQKQSDGTLRWLVRWDGYSSEDDTWEPYSHLKDVDKFHEYCRKTKGMSSYLPRVETKSRKRVSLDA